MSNPHQKAMAQLTVGDGEAIRKDIARCGFYRLNEPAVGGGSTVLAFCNALRSAGINYQHHLHVTAVDIDPTCVHMTYLQLALCWVPAVVIVGNTLTLEEREHWFTPAHILDGWNWKLRQRDVCEDAQELLVTVPSPTPEPIHTDELILPTIPADKRGQLALF